MIPQPQHDLMKVPLSAWIEWQNKYGQDLDDRFAAIQKMPHGEDRANEYLLYDFDYTICNYCLYSGLPLEEVNKMDSKEVILAMGKAFIAHKKQEQELDYHVVHEWNGEKWKVWPLFISKGRKLTYEEFDKSQDLALIFSDFQDGKHEALYPLCASYFRKVGEPYTMELADYEGERVALMKSLPMYYALMVRKYTLDTLEMYLSTVQR